MRWWKVCRSVGDALTEDIRGEYFDKEIDMAKKLERNL